MAQNVICLGECSMWAWEKCFSTAIAVVGWNILDMSMRSSWLTGLLSSTVSLWILCLLDLLITEKRMLMTWIIIVAMYIFLSVLLAFLSSNLIFFFFFLVVQFSPVAQSCLTMTPWTAACQASSLYIINSWSLLKFMSIESVMPSSHLILYRPLLLPSSIFPSIRVFSNVSILIRWPKYWGFRFNISPSNVHSGLISFRMDWFDPWSPRDSQVSFPTPQFKSSSILYIQLSL